ncbi:MAG: serine/threonine protein kinase [Deltaproteobacteria bacterium]|nr:serine/threonine protein kinase [Deltaproteobacteria bacterium]
MLDEAKGICPNCEKHTGPLGQPCPSEACTARKYHFVPMKWFDAAKAYAERKRKALDPLLGRRIDRYLLAGKVGEGGMGSVYLALQEPLNREVALKLISGVETGAQMIARFEREARAISALDHPNIVKLYDYGVGDLGFQVPFMAIEYIRRGRTLRRVLAQVREEGSGGAAAPMVGAIFQQILNALGAAHAVGIVHRDMKPENVMVAAVYGNPHLVKVLDFGLARSVSDGVAGGNLDSDLSAPGQILGTLHYMAPEQAQTGTRLIEVDGRADLYAVGVMLFEVFCGARPFEGGSPLEILARKVDPAFDAMTLPAARSLPKPLREVLFRSMHKDPDARYPTAADMLGALEHALAGRITTIIGFVIDGASASEPIPTPDLDPEARSLFAAIPPPSPSEGRRGSPPDALDGPGEDEDGTVLARPRLRQAAPIAPGAPPQPRPGSGASPGRRVSERAAPPARPSPPPAPAQAFTSPPAPAFVPPPAPRTPFPAQGGPPPGPFGGGLPPVGQGPGGPPPGPFGGGLPPVGQGPGAPPPGPFGGGLPPVGQGPGAPPPCGYDLDVDFGPGPRGAPPKPAAPSPRPQERPWGGPSPQVHGGAGGHGPVGPSLDVDFGPTTPEPPPRGGGTSPGLMPAASGYGAGARGGRMSASRGSGARPAPRSALESPTTRILLTLGIALLLSLPVGMWALQRTRIGRVNGDLELIRSALKTSGGTFVGVRAAPLETGDNVDYFIREGGMTGAGIPTRDPWGRRYRVKYALDRRAWLAISTGPDGQPGSCASETGERGADDICIEIGQ